MEETGLAAAASVVVLAEASAEVLAEASAAAAASVEASVFEVLAEAYCMASDLRHSDNTSDTPEPAEASAVAAYHLALAASAVAASAAEVLAAERMDIPP